MNVAVLPSIVAAFTNVPATLPLEAIKRTFAPSVDACVESKVTVTLL